MPKPIDILISTYDSLDNPYFGGGGAQAVHEVAKRLAKQHSVTILHGNFSGARTSIRDGVRYQPFGPVVPHPQLGQLVFQLLLPLALFRSEFAVWIESFTPPFSTAFLPLFTRKPVIGLVHLLSAKAMAAKYKLPFLPWIERVGVRQYERLIALTETSKIMLQKLAPNSKVTVIPNGVDIPIRVAKQAKRTKLVFIGRIDTRQKGLDVLIAAFDRCAETVPFDLHIAGGGREASVVRLKRLIVKSKFANRIHYVGAVHGKAKAALFNQAVALILPSRYETQPLVLFEGFAAQCPVITSDIPDLAWVSKKHCQKAELNPQKIAEKIVWTVSNPTKIQQQVERAYQYVQQFSWKRTAGKYESLIAKITNKHEIQSKKILLTHFFTEKNLGDAGIVQGMLQEMRRVFPKSTITLLRAESSSAQSLFEKMDVTTLSSHFFLALYTTTNPLIRVLLTVWIITTTTIWTLLFRLSGLQADWLVQPRVLTILRAYRDANLIMAVGGGYLTGKNDLRGFVTIVLQLHAVLLGLLLKKPVYLYAQSIGPFGNSLQAWLTGKVLNSVSLVCCRETISLKVAQSIGIAKQKLALTVDAGFLLRASDKDHTVVAQLLKKYQVSKRQKIVGITVRAWLEPKAQAAFEQAVAETIEFIRQKYGYQVLLIPQVIAAEHNDDDRHSARRVFSKVATKSGVYLLDERFAPATIKALYETLDFFIGTRMHSNIFSLTGLVPLIAIEYEPKTRGIMRMLGFERWVLKMEAVNTKNLTELFAMLVRERLTYKKQLKSRVPKIVRLAEKSMDLVARHYERNT
ncbi:glycosyltransferase [Candidatus Woesebacteria bacterium]|nr:glycosyltransferase [Candidatus Woesebacteria bacterium]